jgi:hypothetical protein
MLVEMSELPHRHSHADGWRPTNFREYDKAVPSASVMAPVK